MKPLSNEEEEPVAREEPEEPEDEAHLKEKKPSDTDDDDEEPPPPYTPYDPQEEKSDDSKKDQRASSERRGEGVADDETVHGNDTQDISGSSLLNQHPKLIPESSLGFQVQPSKGGGATTVEQQAGKQAGKEESVARERNPISIDTSESESGGSSRPATSSPLSPKELSRISSPEKGRTLAEMTMITPEDEARVILHETQQNSALLPDGSPRQLDGGVVDCQTASSDSNTTLVNTQSQQSQSESNTNRDQSNSQPVASSSSGGGGGGGGGGLKLTSFLKGKGKAKKHDKAAKSSSADTKAKEKHKKGKKDLGFFDHSPQSPKNSATTKKGREKTKDPASLEVNHTPQSPQALKVSYSAQALGNSQESFVDGLSPELSDYGEHSNEVDYSPREAKILRAGYNIGLSIDLDYKNNCIVVKSVSSGGAVGRDGRIRVGDCIEAVNGKILAGLSLNRAKGILKRASKSDEISIMYSPASGPQFLPPMATNEDKAQTSLPVPIPVKASLPQKHNPYYSMAAPLREEEGPLLPAQGPQMQPLHPQVQGLPPHMIQQTGQWQMDSVSPYGSSMHHMQQQGYWPREEQMGNPPPPYLFPHQPPPPGPPAGPGRINGGQYTPIVGSSQPPPPQMTWQPQITAPQGKQYPLCFSYCSTCSQSC